jgi:uncharacterized protein (TIRG00374 family)
MDPEFPHNPCPIMHKSVKHWTMFILRWGIAVVGIWYVIANISWRDRALILDPQTHRPIEVRLAQPADDHFARIWILDPIDGTKHQVFRSDLVNAPDQKHVTVKNLDGQGTRSAALLALDLSDDLKSVQRFLIDDPATGKGVWVGPSDVVDYHIRVPYPRVQEGLRHMLHEADASYLIAAVAIFPITFLITGFRWHLLLLAAGINLGAPRAFVLNMVGAFYNTFMPGSTGGDVLKAWYAAKLVPDRKTRAVMSVIVDRVIGLLALVILGGVMAAYLALSPHLAGDAVAQKCRQVAAGALLIIAATTVGLAIFYVPLLRRATGLNFILRRLPMQRQVHKAVETMERYGRRPGLVGSALLMTFPVHTTVIISAMFAGMAFGLPLTAKYYWVVVPVVVLAGSMPISPQGAGVMEFFAILLTRRQGCTVAQAFALTMSIRLVQIVWNLVGGIFVFRGGFHAPSEAEQHELEEEDGSTVGVEVSQANAHSADSPAPRVIPTLNPEP